MTDQPQYPSYPGQEPTPPAGGSPPPYGQQPPPGYQPPPAYGQQPAYGYQPPPAYGAPYGQGPATPYAGWWSRVGALLLDSLILFAIVIIPLIVGLVITFQDAEVDPVTEEITGGIEPVGIFILALTGIVYLAFDIWNRAIRVGKTGQSLGKKIVGIRVVKATDGSAIGGGAAFGRWAIPMVAGFVPLIGSVFSLIDVLWPLWDERNQTLHDKAVGSVVITA